MAKKYVYAVMDCWRADIEDGASVIDIYAKREDAEEAVKARKKEVLDDMDLRYDHEEWSNGEFYGWNDNDSDYTEIQISQHAVKE